MKVRLAQPVPAPEGAPLSPSPAMGDGLSGLDDLPLDEGARRKLEAAQHSLRGDPAWRTRKAMELRDLYALESLSERLEVLEVDARTELLVQLRLYVPVPVMPLEDVRRQRRASGSGANATAPEPKAREHRVELGAKISIRYPADLLRGPLAGYDSVRVVQPRDVWHPNVSYDRQGRVCLGTSVRRGTPLRELVLQVYSALALQALTLEHGDPAGVMNAAAVRYWRERREALPLTKASILEPLADGTAS